MFSSSYFSKIMPSMVSFFLGAITSGVVFGALYTTYGYAIQKLRSKKGSNDDDGSSDVEETFTDILMFPDISIACKDNFILDTGCIRAKCRQSHEKTSLSEIYRHLCNAKLSICVCVFHITYSDLAEVLIAMHKKGVQVKVITDDENVNEESQVAKLKDNGIIVRTDNSSSFMHHKFTVIDHQIVIHGSFNWTLGAITGNLENVLITNDADVARNFQEEFDSLWENFQNNSINKEDSKEYIPY